MKQRLFIVLAFVFMTAAVVALEFQLRCTQMELQGSADVASELCRAIDLLAVHSQQAFQKTSKKEAAPDRHDSK